ncbi:MAG: DUF2905 domain-containing protein [Betaproteobacteria bacterium]|nr:DUF2905 domain-containing protein [Betaproteobacteria bacterium]
MLKWLIVLVVCVVLLGLFSRQLSRMGLGRLPGDLRFTKNGREYYLPITSTVLISLLLTLIARFI